jgi:hypothetical protein
MQAGSAAPQTSAYLIIDRILRAEGFASWQALALKKKTGFVFCSPYNHGVTAAQLRIELVERAKVYAVAYCLPHCLSYAEQPTVCFETLGSGQHGNFHAASYKRIVANPEWRRRLNKVHTTAKRQFPASENGRRRELDSCTSSDALLMNVFCYPGTMRATGVRALLGLAGAVVPEFGVRGHVPLERGRFDRTEIDMRIGNLLVEAKLTEGDFQRASKGAVHRYRDFDAVFHEEELPQSEREFTNYQLIRGVLAAHAVNGLFCLFTDARRADLIEMWYATVKCVRILDLRLGCKLLTWQELTQVVPRALRSFLVDKYGI